MRKVVIVGASITGTYAMIHLVKKQFDGEITLIDKKNVTPYNPYPLSKDWMRDPEDWEPPLLKKPDYYVNHNINLRLNTEVTSIDPKEKVVKTSSNEMIPYDDLVIATGSILRKIHLPGDDAHGIFYLREFDDAMAIKKWAEKAQDVVIVGSGFIGLELASTFSQLGKKVSVLVRSGKPLANILGEEVSQYFTRMHQSHGVSFLFNDEPQEFIQDESGNVTAILTKNGKTLPCDMALLAVGVTPHCPFAVDSLEMDGGILVNEFGETSIPGIYAGGDVAKWPYKGNLIHVEHWENAWSQGVSIAENILSEKSHEYKVPPYFWTDQYDETFEYLGNTKTWDKIMIRGSLEDKYFSVAYVDKDNHPLAVLFANHKEEREVVERLITNDLPLDERKFSNPDVALSEL